MEAAKMLDEQITPMEDVAPRIKGLRIVFVNVFGVEHGAGEWTLIDAALPFTATLIRSWAEKNFHRPPKAIVLTHGHFDHISAARRANWLTAGTFRSMHMRWSIRT